MSKIRIPNGYCTTRKKGILRGFDLLTLLIADEYCMHDKFFLHKNVRISQNVTFDDILKYPGTKDLLFNKKSKDGVFPHVFYPKYNTCLLSDLVKLKKKHVKNIINLSIVLYSNDQHAPWWIYPPNQSIHQLYIRLHLYFYY